MKCNEKFCIMKREILQRGGMGEEYQLLHKNYESMRRHMTASSRGETLCAELGEK